MLINHVRTTAYHRASDGRDHPVEILRQVSPNIYEVETLRPQDEPYPYWTHGGWAYCRKTICHRDSLSHVHQVYIVPADTWVIDLPISQQEAVSS